MAGIAEVAMRAGVSPATASRALTGRGYVAADTRTRVEAAAAELGYVASSSASSLVTGRTNTIGVVMPALNRWFFAEVLEGIQESLLEHRYDLALYGGTAGAKARQDMFGYFLARKRFDGIIAVGIEPSAHELERIAAFDRPMVSVGGYDIGTDAVSIDDESAGHIATDHLIGLGHRDIVFLGGDPDGRRTSFGDARRLAGYETAMRSGGLEASVRHVRSPVAMPAGYAAGSDLLADRRTRPSAIVAVCDDVAIGAIIAARRLGLRVPSDLSVVGIDDPANAAMFALTTLRQNPREQGRTAAQLLVRRIEEPDAAVRRVREPSPLIVRSTTAARDAASPIVADAARAE
ncbi:MAG: LacI family DNA-binding transcriptional regulator [Microbacterium sp.]|uniref:LacI family DNA-binding transcriptional regulator n=1 Tax=Microbacterium sp. TaxID=51671 RepID=UPI003A89C2C9